MTKDNPPPKEIEELARKLYETYLCHQGQIGFVITDKSWKPDNGLIGMAQALISGKIKISRLKDKNEVVVANGVVVLAWSKYPMRFSIANLIIVDEDPDGRIGEFEGEQVEIIVRRVK